MMPITTQDETGLLALRRFLDWKSGDLDSSVVLELGSGKSQLGEDLKVKGSSMFYAMDLSFLHERDVSADTSDIIKSTLPFSAERVDKIIALFAIPFCLKQESELMATLKEFERVLRPGGEARLYPLLEILGTSAPRWKQHTATFPFSVRHAFEHVYEQFERNHAPFTLRIEQKPAPLGMSDDDTQWYAIFLRKPVA